MARLAWALAALALGCGQPGGSEALPRASAHPARVSELPAWPWEGVEFLSGISYRPANPVHVVRAVAEGGGGHLRLLTSIPRWGPEDVPPKGWWVDPVRDRDEWLYRRTRYVEAAIKYRIRIILCLFDEPTRWDRPHVRDALWREGVDPRFTGTWLGKDVSEGTAIILAEWWLDGLEPSPWLIVETSNEPQDIPGMPEDALEAWLERRGYVVSRNTRYGSSGPYGSPTYLWEHAWGTPDATQPWPPLERLEGLRAEGLAPRLGLSTDGFAGEEWPGETIEGRAVLDLGIGYSVLTRVAPHLLDAPDVPGSVD